MTAFPHISTHRAFRSACSRLVSRCRPLAPQHRRCTAQKTRDLSVGISFNKECWCTARVGCAPLRDARDDRCDTLLPLRFRARLGQAVLSSRGRLRASSPPDLLSARAARDRAGCGRLLSRVPVARGFPPRPSRQRAVVRLLCVGGGSGASLSFLFPLCVLSITKAEKRRAVAGIEPAISRIQ